MRMKRRLWARRLSGAPAFSGALAVGDAVTDWVKRASGPDADGHWWRIVEEHALAALAEDPGMEFGLLPPDDLVKLPVVESDAAKRGIFDRAQPDAWQALQRILRGESLAPYAGTGTTQPDPIADGCRQGFSRSVRWSTQAAPPTRWISKSG
jgi:hypothetical protein